MSVYCYITGFKFRNIYGGMSEDHSGYITHITHMTPMMQQRWPWLRNMWSLNDHRVNYGYFKTLREAKAEAQKRWPGCGFKTPAQVRRELDK